MSNIKALTRPVQNDIVRTLEDHVERAKRGEIVNICIVTASIDPEDGATYTRYSDFDDSWQLIAALEYAKHAVLVASTRDAKPIFNLTPDT